MSASERDVSESWLPQSCTLPTADRPLRVAEFDALFTTAVRAADRPSRTRLSLDLEPTAEIAAQAAGLMVRETVCCSFFTFTLTATGGALELGVAVPEGHVQVLDGLAARLAKARA
jgi:hypothetical protein